MEAVDAMDAQTLDKDVIDRPIVNSWRLEPTGEQIRYATDLCRSELPYAERVRTIEGFAALDRRAMSDLIDGLEGLRQRRYARLRRSRRRPR